jgi:WD40 repeat protein
MTDWPRLVHVFNGHTRDVNAVTTSPDGSVVASASLDGTIRFWSTTKGVAIGKPLKEHLDSVGTVAFSPDGTCIASGSNDRTVRFWSASTFEAIGEPLIGITVLSHALHSLRTGLVWHQVH